MAYLSRDWLFLVKGRPLNKLNFWLICNNFYKNQDIALKFSAYVHNMSALNWQRNFWHYSISRSAAPPSVPKLLMPLATIFVEIFSKKFFWWGSRPISATPWKEFWISWKNGVLKFLERVFRPGNFSGSWSSWSKFIVKYHKRQPCKWRILTRWWRVYDYHSSLNDVLIS